MQTAEPKTTSVATKTKANQPFLVKKGEGSFFGKNERQTRPFFHSTPGYSLHSNNFIQPKLTVGQPDDKYEKEADAMADKVVRRLAAPEPMTKADPVVQAKPLASTITPVVQKKCAHCEEEEKLQKKEMDKELLEEKIQRKSFFEGGETPRDDVKNIQRKCAECEQEERLQRKSGYASSATPFMEKSLMASKGSGSPLPSSTRQQMESSFGADFSNIKVHTDNNASQMNKDLHAQAFTHGNDIYFNSAKYNPDTSSGKHLLAHELTHTLQQGAGIQFKSQTSASSIDFIQKYPQAGYALPSTPKQQLYYSHKDEVVDIMGEGKFSPGKGLGNYIASLWENGQDAPVNVKFGSLASGYIYVSQRGSYYSKECLTIPLSLFFSLKACRDQPPKSINYEAPPQVIPFKHEVFEKNDKGSLVLVVGISSGIIYGKLGWIQGKKANDIEPFLDATSVVTGEEAFLPLIYGNDYDGTNYTSIYFKNQLSGGALSFFALGTLNLANQQQLAGTLWLINKLHSWFGNIEGKAKGLENYQIPIDRSADGKLYGESSKLTLDKQWTTGNKESENGIFEAKGQLRASYNNGVFDFFGKASYSSARLNGEVNMAVTQEGKAQALFREHVPAKEAQEAPVILPSKAKDSSKEPLALTAWGNLSFKLIDTNKPKAKSQKSSKNAIRELEGEGAFAVSPEGYIILAGKLKFPARWQFTKPYDYQSDDKEDKTKHLFSKQLTVVRVPVPYGTINLTLGTSLDVHTHLDPLELYEIEVSGVYSNHPLYRSEVGITPRLYISGWAKATIVASAEAAAKALGVFTVATVEGRLQGDALFEAYINAAPTINTIWEGGTKPAQYGIAGTIHAGGELTFALSGDIHIEVVKKKILKKEDYEFASWTLSSFGIQIDMEEFILGSGEKLKIDYSRIKFGKNQRKSLGRAIAKEKERKKGDTDQQEGGFLQVEEGKPVEKGEYSPTEPVRPDEDQQPIGVYEIENDFVMLDKLHELVLSIKGTRSNPNVLLEMSSEKKSLEEKINDEKLELEIEKIIPNDERRKQIEIQEHDLKAIENEAKEVEKNAKGAAQKIEDEKEPEVAGFDKLDDRLSAYAQKYKTDDIGFGPAITPRPSPLIGPQQLIIPKVHGASRELEELLRDKRAEVGYQTFDDFRGTNVAVFRFYVLKPGAKQIDKDADGPFYETAVNVKNELHSEQIIAGSLQEIQKSKEFRKKYAPGSIIAVNQVLTERSPCSMCRDFLTNNPSQLIVTSNFHTYYLVHYSGNWIERNYNLMIRYGLQPLSLAELKKQYGGKFKPDPH